MTQKGKWSDRAQRYLAYKAHVGWKAKVKVKELFTGDLSVNITLYFKKKGRVGDVDNYAKAILDGLNKIAFTDDAQVQELFVRRIFVDVNERAEVTIRESRG